MERQSCDVLVDYRGYQILGRKGPEPPAFQAVGQTHTEAGDLEKSAKCYEEVTVRRSLWDCPWPLRVGTLTVFWVFNYFRECPYHWVATKVIFTTDLGVPVEKWVASQLQRLDSNL